MQVRFINKLLIFNEANPARHRDNHVDKAAWSTGGGSTLRSHIRRNWATHGQTYMQKCRDNNIKPHPYAMPSEDGTPDGDAQATLDGFVKAAPKVTKEGLLDYIVECLVTADLVSLQAYLNVRTISINAFVC